MIIIFYVVIFLLLLVILLRINTKEGFENYGKVQDTRENQCTIYRNNFNDAYQSIGYNVFDVFTAWCENYYRKRNIYPTYRIAERAIIKFKNNL